MLTLDKRHNPRDNAELLQEIFAESFDPRQSVHEAEQLFQEMAKHDFPPIPVQLKAISIPFRQKLVEGIFRFSAKPVHSKEPSPLIVDSAQGVFPEWKDKLDQEHQVLLNQIEREVNVVDFGAIGDGKTDCTSAFNKAIGNGRVKVNVPKGLFLTNGIRLPSFTWLMGAGKGVTTIKLHDRAAKGTRLITNASHWKGNHHLFVEGLSLNWNAERLGDASKTSTWGHHSSCLTFANVTYGWVSDVEAINPGLHCFDMTSTLYNYAGDGYRSRGGSKYVWLDGLSGYGFGDDGITTHHSDYILVTNSHMCDPSGRAHNKGFSNSNGIEIDDGSRNVVLINNSTARCFGGVEVKAHQNSSAASNVQIVGHISLNDNRSFNFRHIGHHKLTDPESKTARNIVAVNLAAIAPVFTDLYTDSAPRGLVVSAYQNVILNQCQFIGSRNDDFKANPIAAIQYRARNVVLNKVSFSNFHNAGAAIKVFGGDNRADSIRIRDAVMETGIKAIEIGSGVMDVKVENINEALTVEKLV